MDNSFIRELADVLIEKDKAITWTGLKDCKVGNGENPPVVIVPASDSPDGELGWFWCYRVIDQTKDVFMAKNTFAGLSYSESIAGTPVKVGYPPGSDILCIYITNPAEMSQVGGGLLPSQIATLEAAAVTPDKIAMNALRAQNSLILAYTGGAWRKGNEGIKVTAANLSFLNVTAYIPATSGKSRWILVAIDEDGDPSITLGAIYSSASLTPFDYIPLGVTDGTLALGWVKLVNGVTALTQREIIPVPDMFFAPDAAGESANDAVYLAMRAARRR